MCSQRRSQANWHVNWLVAQFYNAVLPSSSLCPPNPPTLLLPLGTCVPLVCNPFTVALGLIVKYRGKWGWGGWADLTWAKSKLIWVGEFTDLSQVDWVESIESSRLSQVNWVKSIDFVKKIKTSRFESSHEQTHFKLLETHWIESL